MNAHSDDILTRIEGGVGHLTLNRPGSLNSLTHGMVTAMTQALTAWAADEAVDAVIVSGAGDRGLCAGGDVVAIYHSAKTGGAEARRFWFDEYRLNAYISRYPKPYTALMDGIVMGGGVGISAHGNLRVVTDTTKIAMPEVGIGFIPDVGGTYLLSRAPGKLGLHVALTGAPISGADAISMGLADSYIQHSDIPEFTEAIATDGVRSALDVFAGEPPPSRLAAQRNWIDHCYAGETVADIIAELRGHDEGDAKDAANLIATRSPVALAVTLASVRRAAELNTLAEVLTQEYRVSCGSLRSHDLVEGIRAQLVDKDRNPQWSPASLNAVTDEDVQDYFTPADPDLTF